MATVGDVELAWTMHKFELRDCDDWPYLAEYHALWDKLRPMILERKLLAGPHHLAKKLTIPEEAEEIFKECQRLVSEELSKYRKERKWGRLNRQPIKVAYAKTE